MRLAQSNPIPQFANHILRLKWAWRISIRGSLTPGLAPNFIDSIDAFVIHSLLSVHGETDATQEGVTSVVYDALGAYASSMHKFTELFYVHLLMLYKGSNSKMHFDESLLGIEVPALHMERGVSDQAINLLFQSQFELT